MRQLTTVYMRLLDELNHCGQHIDAEIYDKSEKSRNKKHRNLFPKKVIAISTYNLVPFDDSFSEFGHK